MIQSYLISIEKFINEQEEKLEVINYFIGINMEEKYMKAYNDMSFEEKNKVTKLYQKYPHSASEFMRTCQSNGGFNSCGKKILQKYKELISNGNDLIQELNILQEKLNILLVSIRGIDKLINSEKLK